MERFGTLVRQSARRGRPLYWEAGPSTPELNPDFFLSLLARGFPAHTAAQGRQVENRNSAELKDRLLAGETVFLVQPHEYMPILRRFLWRVSERAGFLGRPLHSFLFCVWKAGTPAMPKHDDGDNDLIWWQIAGERSVGFGKGDEAEAMPVEQADGSTSGWFEGALPAGSLLYLPPFMPHIVQCRRPSLALSAYWEPVSSADAAADFLQWTHGAGAGRSRNPGRRTVSQALRRAADEVGHSSFQRWSALRASQDGALDRIGPVEEGDLWSARRGIIAWREGNEAWLAAGGEHLLSFPREALPVLRAFSGYGTASRSELEALAGPLGARRLDALLSILVSEGLIAPGPLPAIAECEIEQLSGWHYSAFQDP